ncbi:MAG: hypothetical protein PHS31_02215 [Victivallaceae bacterium]|nr:hypothetical protein [Victivallaceae bacterium]
MIYFFSDNHYGAYPGRRIYESLPDELRQSIIFTVDHWDILENGEWEKDCELLILHMIGDTCGQPHPGSEAEKAIKKYCSRGGNILLLHGSSAAFWQWQWWRNVVGERWVRPNDPDGVCASYHPRAPYLLKTCKARHPLVSKLIEIELPEDEIYVALEHTAPSLSLMETTINEGTFVQCSETLTPWGGIILNFIPGHDPSVTTHPSIIKNITLFITYLNKSNDLSKD